MSNKKRYQKEDFIKLILSNADAISNDENSVQEYAEQENLDLENIRSEGKKRIRMLMTKLKAEKARKEMISKEYLKAKALAFVERLMNEVDFSFQRYVLAEQIPLQNRNLESFTDEDIKDTLVKYHFLKMLEAENKDSNEL